MKKLRSFLRLLKDLVIYLILAISIAILLMTLIYRINPAWMEESIDETVRLIEEPHEGYPSVFPWCTSALDNLTDSLMFEKAWYRSDDLPIIQAMLNPSYMVSSSNYMSLIDHYVGGLPYDSVNTYSRYWHGYLLYLKPLVCVLDYGQIRILNGILQTALLLLLCGLMYRNGQKRYILPYLITVGMLMPVTLAMSLQFSSCYYMMTLGCIAIQLLRKRLDAVDGYIFLFIGIGTAFFDFLTYPIATIGVPAVMYFSLREFKNVKDDISRLAKLCFCWCFGYGGMWVGKWFSASIITNSNQFTSALNSFSARVTHSNMTVYSRTITHPILESLAKNFSAFFFTPVTILFLLIVGVLIILRFRSRGNVRSHEAPALESMAVFVLTAMMPIVWYAVVANHSIVHSIFTNKALSAFVYAIMCMLVKIQIPQAASKQPKAAAQKQ